jgi:transcriptional regulator GlxA family with amidase domain
MSDQHDEPTEDFPFGRGRSRRDALMLGGLSALGAIAGASALAGASVPAFAQAPKAPGSPGKPFDILFAIYPDGTLLDFAGPNEVFSFVPNTRIRIASPDGGPVTLQNGWVWGQSERLADIESTDLLLVPGGPDLTAPNKPAAQKEILRLAQGAKYVTSVCTGSLVLAKTGILKGKRAASHWASVNMLAKYGAIPDPQRFVSDDNGRFMSGGGVTSGIDFGLRVVDRLYGADMAQFIQLLIEYDPAPPYNSGHPRVARPNILAMAEKVLPGGSKGLWQIPGY